MLEQILNIFSTREISIITWGIILLISSMFIKGMPKIMGDFLKIIGSKIVIIFTLISAIYTTIIVVLLWKLSIWDITFFKDTCLWFLFSSMAVTFNVHKARDFSFFKKIIKDNIKIILVFEFIVNFYTFSLPIELVLVPTISFIGIVQAFAEVSQKQEPNHQKVASCFGKMMSIFGIGLIIFVIYKTITDYENFFTVYNLKSFLLPINLTLLSLPFYYGLALYMEYESLFTVIRHLKRYKSPSIPKELIRASLLYANININKLSRIRKYHSYFNPEKETPYRYVKRIANKPQYVIGTNAKLPIFNDIANMLQTLSDCGLGKMEEWMNKGGGYYHSSSRFYNFKSAENGILDNSIQYLLTGEETYINQVDIMLNIGLEQNSQEALKIFKDFVLKTLNATNIPIPTKLIQNIERLKKYTKDFDNYIIRFECTKAQKMEWCTLSIITKLNDNSSPYLY